MHANKCIKQRRILGNKHGNTNVAYPESLQLKTTISVHGRLVNSREF